MLADKTRVTSFAIVGGGSIGKRHLRNLKQLGAERLLVVDPRQDRQQEIQAQFGISTFSTLEEALAHGVQAAIICTPSRLHIQQALEAAKAGCHLFIEKPLADSLEGADDLLHEIKLRQLVTLVGCNFRFHPGLRQVKALLDQNTIGTIISARAQFGQYLPDWHPWEDYRQNYSAQRALGGGVVLDRIHEIDYIRWLLGEVSEVFALMGHLSHLDIDTEDTAEILLRFTSGAFGSVHLDYVRRTYDCSLEIIGVRGTIQWSYNPHRVRWYLAHEERWNTQEWPDYDGNTMYLDEMRHFLRALDGLEPSELDVVEGKRVLRLALAAKESATSRKVVAL